MENKTQKQINRLKIEDGKLNMDWVYSKLKIKNSKYLALSAFLFLAFSSLTYAVSIVPCGGTGQSDCTLADLSKLFKNATLYAFEMVSIFAVAMVVYTGFKLMTAKDKAVELSESKERLWKVATGMTLFFGGTALMIMILRSIGINSQFLQMFNFFFATVADVFSAHAYAVVVTDPSTLLPNPVTTSDPLDFLGTFLHLAIRWLVFPCIIFAWFYSGFLYVKAQGNPTEIKDAHIWLWYTLIGTVIIMLAEVFYAVLRGTITNIIN